jgi:enoyl-CoA hydratase/carnithine racemase
MAYSNITLESKGYVRIITLNRPPMNSINMGVRVELDAALTEIEADGESRVVIITGSGEKAFCAGMDVSDVGNLYNGPECNSIYNRIDRFSRPVIAVINGTTLGGGCELTMACHFRFMVSDSAKAVIGCPELNLGITPGWGGIQRMPRILGRSKALECILLSKRMTAAEALAIGLVDKIFPAAGLMTEAVAFAETLARRPPLAVRAVLEGMMTGFEKGLDEGIRTDMEWSKKLAQSQDAMEGFSAFMQKREPEFKGK